jgi:hypothetical protein
MHMIDYSNPWLRNPWFFDTIRIELVLSLVWAIAVYKAIRCRRGEFVLLALTSLLQIVALYFTLPALVLLAPLALAVVLPKHKKEPELPTVSPFFFLTVTLCLAAATRLTGITSLAVSGANDFGWETSASFMAASTWHSAVVSGIKHHSISQGFLWHVMYFFMHSFTDDPILGGRIFFAVISVINIILVFAVSRLLFGNWVALVTSALFAFSPLEPAWARSNYGMTFATFLSLAVAYVAFKSRPFWQIALGSLTMFSYPAATTMGAFPLIVGALYRSRRAVVVGLVTLFLWIILPSIIVSITELTPTWISPLRVHSSDRSIIDIAKKAPNFAESLASSLYKNLVSLVTKLGTFSDGDEYFVLSAIKPKYLLGRVVLIFLPIGLFLIRGTRTGLALIFWLALSLITALTSFDVIPRRFCTFVAPVSIISGYGAAVVIASMWRPTLILLCSTLIAGTISFATYFRDLRAPNTFATDVVAQVEQELKSQGTLVLLDNVPAPCVSWIFHRLGGYAKQGSYISNRTGDPSAPLELTNQMAKEMPWYRDTSIRDTFTPGSVTRIVVFAPTGERPPHPAAGLMLTEHSTATIGWLTLHKFVIEKTP